MMRLKVSLKNNDEGCQEYVENQNRFKSRPARSIRGNTATGRKMRSQELLLLKVNRV